MISEPAVPKCPYSDKIDKKKEGEDESGHVVPYQEVEDSVNTEGQLEVNTSIYFVNLLTNSPNFRIHR